MAHDPNQLDLPRQSLTRDRARIGFFAGAGSEILLGPPFIYSKDNIAEFDF